MSDIVSPTLAVLRVGRSSRGKQEAGDMASTLAGDFGRRQAYAIAYTGDDERADHVVPDRSGGGHGPGNKHSRIRTKTRGQRRPIGTDLPVRAYLRT